MEPLTVAVRVWPNTLKLTEAPSSQAPVMALVLANSLALMVLSPATVSMVGAAGATVSSVKVRLLDLVLPAVSVSVTVTVYSPSVVGAV